MLKRPICSSLKPPGRRRNRPQAAPTKLTITSNWALAGSGTPMRATAPTRNMIAPDNVVGRIDYGRRCCRRLPIGSASQTSTANNCSRRRSQRRRRCSPRAQRGKHAVGEEIGVEALDQPKQQEQVIDQPGIEGNPARLLGRDAYQAVFVAGIGARIRARICASWNWSSVSMSPQAATASGENTLFG